MVGGGTRPPGGPPLPPLLRTGLWPCCPPCEVRRTGLWPCCPCRGPPARQRVCYCPGTGATLRGPPTRRRVCYCHWYCCPPCDIRWTGLWTCCPPCRSLLLPPRHPGVSPLGPHWLDVVGLPLDRLPPPPSVTHPPAPPPPRSGSVPCWVRMARCSLVPHQIVS